MHIMRSIFWISLLAVVGCGGGNSKSHIYEHEIDAQNPASLSQIAIYHLESPASGAPEKDSGGVGWDAIHLAGQSAESRTFCLDLGEGSNHRAQILTDSERDAVSIDNRYSCATVRMESGKAKVSLVHDGVSQAQTVFVYEADALGPAEVTRRHAAAAKASHVRDGSSETKNLAADADKSARRWLHSDEGGSATMTVISATGCPSCNLENADLSGRDLHQMDFSGANLRSANVSKSKVVAADLLNADLADLVTEGAEFSGAIWSDGTVCAPSLKNPCDPLVLVVDSRLPWQNTGLFLRIGRQVVITANGRWTSNPALPMAGPDGSAGRHARRDYSMEGVPEGALVGRLNRSQPFLLGSQGSYRAQFAGSLSLVINDDLEERYGMGLRDNTGTIEVRMRVSE